jgi:hypothetical protein
MARVGRVPVAAGLRSFGRFQQSNDWMGLCPTILILGLSLCSTAPGDPRLDELLKGSRHCARQTSSSRFAVWI